MADSLLTTTGRLAALRASLDAALPSDVAVYGDESFAAGTVPFVVLTATVNPSRQALDGAWSAAVLRLTAESVHGSVAQARALADLVRVWALTGITGSGVLDVATAETALAGDPGGVPQVRESWDVTLTRV